MARGNLRKKVLSFRAEGKTSKKRDSALPALTLSSCGKLTFKLSSMPVRRSVGRIAASRKALDNMRLSVPINALPVHEIEEMRLPERCSRVSHRL